MTEAIRAPNPTGLFGEARGLIEFPKHLVRFPELTRQRRGNGQPVTVLPGYGASDASTCVLRAYLGSLPEPFGGPVKWNFEKYLVRRSGNVVARYKSSVQPATPAFEPIRDFIAFYPEPMGDCFVDGERAASQPGDFYGGWITSNIVGPFNGAPGTRGW